MSTMSLTNMSLPMRAMRLRLPALLLVAPLVLSAQTPTLFMAGSLDFNVPLVGGEQMYQALRALGVPTELVIYPGPFPGITKPSFNVFRMTKWVEWYDKYVKGGTVRPR